jgi:hypothetical protein
MRKQAERETSPDEALAQLSGERNRAAAVRANIGTQVVVLAQSRYGHIRADVWVEAIGERRIISVTDKQAREIVVKAGTRDTDGTTLSLVPLAGTKFDDPREGEDA